MQIQEPGEMYLETIYVLRKRMRLPIKKSLSERQAFSYLLFQVLLENRIKMGKISRRPASMATIMVTLDSAL